MTRISVSLPEKLSRELRRVRAREGAKLSHVVAEALSEYFSRRDLSATGSQPGKSPAVLWKLKATGRVALRSPKLTERRVRDGWIVEEY